MNSKRRSGFQNDTRAYFGLRGPMYTSYINPFDYNPSKFQVRTNIFYLGYY